MTEPAITGPEARLNRRIEQIEAEFAEPISEILAGFARDGESVTATARALEISPQVVRRMATELGIIDAFPGPHQSRAKIEAAKERRGRRIPAISLHQRKLMLERHGFWHEGHYDTLAGHCDRLGVNHRTAASRIRAGMNKTTALTEPLKRRRA